MRRGRAGDGRNVVLLHGDLEQPTPRRDVGTSAKQGATLTFGHTAPDSPLDPVVESLCEALGLDRASRAQPLGAVLCGSVSIGRGTMIGAGTVVMPGVAIGSNCVIAAGSLVRDAVPDNSLAEGHPCRVKHSDIAGYKNLST